MEMRKEQLKEALDSIIVLAQKVESNVDRDLYPSTSKRCMFLIIEEAEKVKKHYQKIVNEQINQSK